MAKNDFDIDFDLDKAESFDPKDDLDSDLDGEFDLDMPLEDPEDGREAYDYGTEGADYSGNFGEDQNYNYDYGTEDPNGEYGYDPNGAYDPDAQYDPNGAYDPDAQYDPNGAYDPDAQYDPNGAYDPDAQYDPNGAYDPDARYDPNGAYDPDAQYDSNEAYDPNAQYEDQGEYAQENYAQEGAEPEAGYEEQEPQDYEEQPGEEDGEYYEQEQPKPKKKVKLPKVKLPKIHFKMPKFFAAFMTLYFGPLIAQATGMAPENEGRRRRSKTRIFKEVYLPPLILFVSLILVLSCIIGSISTAVRGKKVHDAQAQQESIAQAEQADRVAMENQSLLDQAERYAQEYDYEHAIEVLEAYNGTNTQEVQAQKAEYVQAQSRLVEWKDPAGIPNLSFQLLIADPNRAFNNKELGVKYNQNFVTTDEFQRILEALYANNYVMVDFDSFVEVTEDLEGGAESFAGKPIYLPEGKKPVMITETMVNYYDYMIDGNKDGVPDAQGAGFASRLVLDGAGDIKAEMVDKDGNTVVGDYDLVPILETFLKQHPDFAYQGARAVLAVTGEQGIFGYRINSSVISDKGQAYYEEQVAGATELVAALRAKGYTMASFTYGNRNYGQDNATQIQEDLKAWNDQIAPVLGPVNVMVFARESDIGNYTDTKYKALYDKGFRIFVGKGDEPFADITNAHVRQKRLMVTGVNMTFNPGMFSGMFDPAAVMSSVRPDVIKPGK